VVFPHKKHAEDIKVECKTCHHDSAEEPAPCFSCHKKEKEEDNEAIPARDAFHKLCITCHKERKDDKTNPPVKCLECHKKENP
jgi:hypothetical protein